MITLYSFVGVDPPVVDVELFRRFLAYYDALGIESFVFDFQTNSDLNEGRLEDFRSIAEQFNAQIAHVVREPYMAHANHVSYMNQFIREYGTTREWCILADSDEFIELPGGARTFLRQCDDQGVNLVVGRLFDRFAGDGTFPVIRADLPLDEQFPMAYPLTRLIRTGLDRKVVALKGQLALTIGRHAVDDEGGLRAAVRESQFAAIVDEIAEPFARSLVERLYPFLEPEVPGIRKWLGRVKVHHFAWDSTLRKKMEARMHEPGCEYLVEIANVLSFIAAPDPSQLTPHLLERAWLGI
jgi:hypothetical protein